MAIDVLEQEAPVLPAMLLGEVKEDISSHAVLPEGDPLRRRVVRVVQVVGDAVEDHVAAGHLVDPETQRRRTTHGRSEAEGEETDNGHEENDADEAHLFPPRPPLGLCGLATALEDEVGAPESDDGAVDVPESRGPQLVFCGLLALAIAPALAVLGDLARLSPGGARPRMGVTFFVITAGVPAPGPMRRRVGNARVDVGAGPVRRAVKVLDGIVARRRRQDVHVGGMLVVMVVAMVSSDPVPLESD